jgi:quercetin dioxygenase-like cupin family protein
VRLGWKGVPLLAWAALAQAQSLDPISADPQHYKLEIENQWVRVIREHMAPHDTMAMHQHPGPGAVIVLLADRSNRLIAPDGKSQDVGGHAGDVMWSLPSTHRSENLTGAAFEGLQIEPRRPASAASPFVTGAMDAPAVDPQHYHVEFENEYVRVLRVTIGPHQKLRQHTHPNTFAVLVQLTDQNLRLTPADGASRVSKYPAGLARWVEPPGAAHQDENLADTPLKFIRVELKQAVPAK